MISRFVALLKPVASRVAPAFLSLIALICFVIAAFLAFGLPVGLCAVGGALLLAEWRMVEPAATGPGGHR